MIHPTSRGQFGARVDGNIKLSIFLQNEAGEVIEADEVVEAVEVIEATEVVEAF